LRRGTVRRRRRYRYRLPGAVAVPDIRIEPLRIVAAVPVLAAVEAHPAGQIARLRHSIPARSPEAEAIIAIRVRAIEAIAEAVSRSPERVVPRIIEPKPGPKPP